MQPLSPKEVEDRLADMILRDEVNDGDSVAFGVKDNEIYAEKV